MKHSISTLLAFLFLSPVLSAQSPLYIEYDPNCVNQLEYQFTYSGQNLLMYSIPKGENELYFFVISNREPSTTSKTPSGTVPCKSDEINATLIDNINAGGRLAYMVFKAQNGFLSFAVESAGYIARSGTYFAFRSPHYDFVMDTASINYARNLSRPGVASPVYLTGRRSQECLQLYAFRLEPSQPESPRADVEVIPGIGIISDRTGHNGSEMEQNVYRLLKINNIGLDDYVYAACHNSNAQGASSSSFITSLPPGASNPNDAFRVDNPFSEPDKETYYTQPTLNTGGNLQLAKCPTPPGYGYHIVQPGDSIGSIARIYNLDPRLLMQWNGLQDARRIKVCDKIWITPQQNANPSIPAPTSGYHVVQKGETLYGIGRKYNLTEANIRQLNDFPASGTVTIIPGQRLVVSNKAQATNEPKNNPNQSYPNPLKQQQQNNVANTAPGGRMTYKTQKGETLNSISWKYGYTTPYLRHINRSNTTLPATGDVPLPEGTVLVVSDTNGERSDLTSFVAPGAANLFQSPATPPTSTAVQTKFEYIGEHIVQSDDTLDSIARRYGLAPEKLAAANNIKPGQQPAPRSILKIPK